MKAIQLKTIFLLVFSIMLSSISLVYASEEKGNIIEDTYGYFTTDEQKGIESEVEKLPEIYKLIVLPTVYGSIENSGRAFFEHKGLSQDTILILILTDDKKIFAMTGEALKERGLDTPFFEQEIENYFVPSVKTKSVAEAIVDLVQGISSDLPKYIQKNKNSPKLPDPPKTLVIAKGLVNNWDFIKILYVSLSVVLIIIIGLIFSKGIYRKR